MRRRVLTVEGIAWTMAALMAMQSSLGLVRPQEYCDAEWIKATWYGNDSVTLAAALPLLALGILHARRGPVRGRLVLLGISGCRCPCL